MSFFVSRQDELWLSILKYLLYILIKTNLD